MTAEIICVGTEILLGNIVNTNAAYLEHLWADGEPMDISEYLTPENSL